jgi:hypothetical protein
MPPTVKKKSITVTTTTVTIGPPEHMAPTRGPQPEAAFMPVDFEARQESLRPKRLKGGPVAEAKAKTKKNPVKVPPTKVGN